MSTYAEIYSQAIANGCTPKMADMLASRCPPGTNNTDRAFLEGWGHTDQFEGDRSGYGERVRAVAAAAGVSTTGKRYLPSLAKYQGDPEAWVSDLGDVRRVCAKNGWGCPEAGVRQRENDQPGLDDKPYEVAPDIVQREMRQEVAADPDLKHSKKKLADKVHEVKKKLAGGLGK